MDCCAAISVKIFYGNILDTFCANLMKIGPVTPKSMRVATVSFWTTQQKWAIPQNIFKSNRVRTDSSSDTDRGPIWVNLD